MTDAEIAGYMSWRGPGAYTQHQLKRVRTIVEEVQRRERAACVAACSKIEDDKWALYKGQPPYTGQESGRAQDFTQGQADGAALCVDAIQARGQA